MFCLNCGTQVADTAKFCPKCGMNPGVQQSQPPYERQQQPIYEQQQPVHSADAPTMVPNSEFRIPNSQPPPVIPNSPSAPIIPNSEFRIPDLPLPVKKKSPGKMIAIIAAVVVVLAVGILSFLRFFNRDEETPVDTPEDVVSSDVPESQPVEIVVSTEPDELPYVTYTYMDKKPEAVIEFTTVDSVFPSNYRSMDDLAVFTGYSDYGELDVLIEVEVPGFTQQYRKMVTLGRQMTKLRIVPPLVTGTLELESEKTAQLVYSVTEVDSGRLLVQESKNIKLYSKFDMMWGDFEGDDIASWYVYADNILAWMTPNAPEILSLKRDAIDYLSFISDGELDGLYGYQNYNYFDHYYYNAWVQAVAIQGAMSDIVAVRYNNSGFSMDAQQRVKLPADTLSSRSGICIETTMVMASALQSAGMHAMLVLPPGHAQVAVEAWPSTGDYFLIETTMLPMERNNDAWLSTVYYMSKDDWRGYLSGEGDYTMGECYVVDCDLGEKLGIRAMSN